MSKEERRSRIHPSQCVLRRFLQNWCHGNYCCILLWKKAYDNTAIRIIVGYDIWIGTVCIRSVKQRNRMKPSRNGFSFCFFVNTRLENRWECRFFLTFWLLSIMIKKNTIYRGWTDTVSYVKNGLVLSLWKDQFFICVSSGWKEGHHDKVYFRHRRRSFRHR